MDSTNATQTHRKGTCQCACHLTRGRKLGHVCAIVPEVVLRAYVATQWNTVLDVIRYFTKPSSVAKHFPAERWVEVVVDNNGGEPHTTTLPASWTTLVPASAVA